MRQRIQDLMQRNLQLTTNIKQYINPYLANVENMVSI